MARVAELLGQPLMPWQRHVADVAGELLPDGRPAYRQVIHTVPRQSGKTVLDLVFELDRAINWADTMNWPQLIMYGAQSGGDARKKFLADQLPVLRRSKRLMAMVDRVLTANGNESLVFQSGSRLELMASTESSGHGRSIDLAIVDEVWDAPDDRYEQALIPAMATKPYAQSVWNSTAGTDASVFLRRLVDRGRAEVEAGRTEGIAYFEWSAPEDADPDDEDVWWSCMPALGHTIGIDAVRHARSTTSDGGFRRAWLNQWTASGERVIPEVTWQAIQSTAATPDVEVVFGLDATPDRSSASLVAVGAQAGGGTAVQVVDARPGVSWVPDRVVEVASRWGAPVVVLASGSAVGWVPGLESAGVTVRTVSPSDYAAACATFYDAVADATMSVFPSLPLDLAVGAARRRVSGDRWTWHRTSDTDISSLVAASIALWGHGPGGGPAVEFYV